MEILWGVVGVSLGMTLMWLNLRRRHKRQLADREAAYLEQQRNTEEALVQERAEKQDALDTLSRSQYAVEAANKRINTLQTELDKAADKLKDARNENKKTKRLLSDANASEAAALETVRKLKAGLAAADQKLKRELRIHAKTKRLVSDLKTREDLAVERAAALETKLGKPPKSAADADQATVPDRLTVPDGALTARLETAQAEHEKSALAPEHTGTAQPSSRVTELQKRAKKTDLH